MAGKVRYEGEWSEGKYNGTGLERCNSTLFEGQFRNGLRHGQGTLSCGGTVVFSSEFNHGDPINEGQGFSSTVTQESFSAKRATQMSRIWSVAALFQMYSRDKWCGVGPRFT